jgi:hypothetical protein
MHISNKTQYSVNKLKLMQSIMSITKSEILILTRKYKFSFLDLIFRTAESGECGSISEQNMNNDPGLSRYGANLELQEIAHLRELIAAGVDEDAFHLAFTQLRTSPSVSDQSVARIARGYTDDRNEIADRDAALGAIETHFYDQRRTAHQSRQTGGRSAGG